jgi:tripartite-type tricarboxylate transporter receptor subunit TctC
LRGLTRTPKPIIDKLHSAFTEFSAMADIKEKLSAIGAEPGSTSPGEFAAMIKRDIARWKKVAQEVGIRL